MRRRNECQQDIRTLLASEVNNDREHVVNLVVRTGTVIAELEAVHDAETAVLQAKIAEKQAESDALQLEVERIQTKLNKTRTEMAEYLEDSEEEEEEESDDVLLPTRAESDETAYIYSGRSGYSPISVVWHLDEEEESSGSGVRTDQDKMAETREGNE